MLLNWTTPGFENVASYRRGINRAYTGDVGSESIAAYTDDFITAATASIRCPKAMVEVTWAESSTDLDRTITSNDINRIDRTGQLFNKETTSGRQWAYIHSGLKADGTFYACPELDTESQMGWFGSAQESDGSGDFSTPPYLEVEHVARPYATITVIGDSVYNEYPVDFDIIFTHPGGTTTINVTGNTERVYTSTFSIITGVTKVKLVISKWSAVNTVVKIIQFTGDFVELYKNDEIVSLSLLEESNSDTGIVPIGNVSANELDLSLLNTDRRFSHGNTDSDYVNVLRSNRKIRVWLGFILPVGSTDQTGDVTGYIVETVSGEKIGYMPYGVFWSKDWISSYASQETTTTAYDIVYQLSQKDFLKSSNYTATVNSIVNTLLTEALNDVPDFDWEVHGNIASIEWTSVSFENKSYMEILKDIAEATLSYIYVDKSGVLIVGSRLAVDSGALETYQEIGLDTYFDYKSEPKIDELSNIVRVGFSEYVLGSPDTSIYSGSEVFTIPVGETELKLYITWSTQPVLASSVVVALAEQTGSALLTSVEGYANGGEITVTGNAGDTFKVTATGQPYTLEEDTETTAEDAESIRSYGKREFALTGNALIATADQAQEIADELIEYYGDLRNDGVIRWNPSTLVSVGGTLEVVEFESDTVETKTNFTIKRQTLKFAGYLTGSTELRRGAS